MPTIVDIRIHRITHGMTIVSVRNERVKESFDLRIVTRFGVTHSGKRLSMRHDVDKSFFRGTPADPRKGSRCIVAVKGEER